MSLKLLKNLADKTFHHPDWGQFILSVFSVLLLEIVARGSILSAFVWTFTMPHRFIFFACIFFIFTRTISAIIVSFRFSWILLFIPAFFLSLIHAVKFSTRNEPLFPWDLILFREAKAILGIGFFPFSTLQIAVILTFFTATTLLVWSLPKRPMPVSSRIFSLLLSIAIFVSVFCLRHIDSWREFCLRSGFHPWNQSLTTARLGFLPSFLMNLPSAVVPPPRGYSPERADRILSKFSSDNRKTDSLRAKEPVNLIIFLAEGFWDPVGLKKIELKKDPLPNYHCILKNNLAFELISPVLAGNTCNVELELLTGLNMAFFPVGSIPYQQYIHRKVESLASVLSRNGYISVAIHPFHKWFFNRNRVYPLLGFDRFISQEAMARKEKSGEYISDMSLANEIIDTASNSPCPFFIFAVSMENHSPYPPDRYEKKFEDPGFNEAERILDTDQIGILNTYITGINHSDSAIGRLIDHFSKIERKTMIVFLGDHLPYLDSNYNIFRDAGYLESDNLFPDMFQQKVVIWTNYKINKIKMPNLLSYSHLPAIILNIIDIPLSSLIEYTDTIREKYPVIHHKLVPANINDYKIIQYHIVFNND